MTLRLVSVCAGWAEFHLLNAYGGQKSVLGIVPQMLFTLFFETESLAGQ